MITTFKAKLVLISLLLAPLAMAAKLQEEKELDVVNFSNIKNVLEKDGLSENASKKTQEVKVLKKKKIQLEKGRFFYPSMNDFWGFISEYWLVKNAQMLGWDFEKPDYGLEASFRSTMEKLGLYQKKFKILLLNTPSTVRAALPGHNKEVIYLLSIPFVRSMDLSKLEISLLLIEDHLRHEAGDFQKNVETEKMKKLTGENFAGNKPDLSMVEELLKSYSKQIYDKGFTFQQQFEITKKMDAYLKSNPELWNVYFRLLKKMEGFLKTNVQYKDYVRLYPSPEMQIKWLSPEEKAL
jgi:hypothetical protein